MKSTMDGRTNNSISAKNKPEQCDENRIEIFQFLLLILKYMYHKVNIFPLSLLNKIRKMQKT